MAHVRLAVSHLLDDASKALLLDAPLRVLPGIERVRVDNCVRPADAAVLADVLVADLEALL